MRSEAKQARSELTQANILTAVIEAGAEVGYSSAKTRDIARRAHVSEGGMFRHFSSKAALFAHGWDVAARGLLDDHVPTLLETLQAGSVPGVAAVLIAGLEDPRTHVVIDVMASARTDVELAKELSPLARAFEADLIEALGPAIAGEPELAHRLGGALSTLMGRQLYCAAFGMSPADDRVPHLVAEHVLGAAGGL